MLINTLCPYFLSRFSFFLPSFFVLNLKYDFIVVPLMSNCLFFLLFISSRLLYLLMVLLYFYLVSITISVILFFFPLWSIIYSIINYWFFCQRGERYDADLPNRPKRFELVLLDITFVVIIWTTSIQAEKEKSAAN